MSAFDDAAALAEAGGDGERASHLVCTWCGALAAYDGWAEEGETSLVCCVGACEAATVHYAVTL